ncbi:hypothetical protein GCM10028815_09180 [Mariniluteicoccus flavus]
MGRGWTGFTPPPGYTHAPGGDAFAALDDVRGELRRRVQAVAYEHVLATTRGDRQVLGARALDRAGRCVAWVLVVELDGSLPHLHLSPQRFRVEDDVALGDQTFDLMYRVDATDHGDPRSAFAREWLGGFVGGVRDLLVTHRPLDLAVCDRHLLHVRTGATSPAEALDAFDDEALFLVELADRLGAEVYARFGRVGTPAGQTPDIAVDDAATPDPAAPARGGRADSSAWPLLPGAAAAPPSPPMDPASPWPLLPRGPIGGPDDPEPSV